MNAAHIGMLVPAPMCCLPLDEPDIISLLPVTTGMSAAPAMAGSMQSTNCLCLTQAPHVTPASPTLPCPAGRVQHQAAREPVRHMHECLLLEHTAACLLGPYGALGEVRAWRERKGIIMDWGGWHDALGKMGSVCT